MSAASGSGSGSGSGSDAGVRSAAGLGAGSGVDADVGAGPDVRAVASAAPAVAPAPAPAADGAAALAAPAAPAPPVAADGPAPSCGYASSVTGIDCHGSRAAISSRVVSGTSSADSLSTRSHSRSRSAGMGVSTRVEGRGTRPAESCCGLLPLSVRYRSVTRAAVSWKEAFSRDRSRPTCAAASTPTPSTVTSPERRFTKRRLESMNWWRTPRRRAASRPVAASPMIERAVSGCSCDEPSRAASGGAGGIGYSTTVIGPMAGASELLVSCSSRGSSSTTISRTGSSRASSTR